MEVLAKHLIGKSDFAGQPLAKTIESHGRKIESNELSRPLGGRVGRTAYYFQSLPLCRNH